MRVETNYCVTLDRVPEELWDEVLQNESQIAEWQEFSDLDETLERDGLFNRGLTRDFIKRHQTLVLDTINFLEDFKLRLLSYFDDLSRTVDGTLIKSENLQGLSMLLTKYRGQIKCIYIDPPYNTGSDEFIYKDNYQHSCWLSMMFDRLLLAHYLLHPSGAIGISIDNNELEHLLTLMDMLFGRENRKAIITVKRGSVTGPKVINPGVVNVAEFLVIYSKNKSNWTPNRVYRERERDTRYSKFITNREQEPAKWVFTSLLQAFADFKGMPKTKLKKTLGEDYEIELEKFVMDNADSVVRTAALDADKRSKGAMELKKISEDNPETVYCLIRDRYEDLYIIGGERILFYSDRLVWIGSQLVKGELVADIWDDTLPNDLHNEGGVTLKKGKKPEKLVGRLIELVTNEGELVVDFFVGSGTACAAAQKMGRKWVGIEMEGLFDPILKRRLKNTLFGEISGISSISSWSGGGFFSYKKLESYEDVLNNLEIKRTDSQQSLLSGADSFRENYMLSYMLDVESRGSASLLNVDAFEDPFNYRLKIAADSAGETKPVTVDLVETFNYLLGLTVHHIDHIHGFRVVQGTSPEGGKVLVIWRNLKEKSNDDLEEFFRKQEYNPKDMEFDLIYVNGDNNLENIRRTDETWKVRLIEEDFQRLMFDVEDI